MRKTDSHFTRTFGATHEQFSGYLGGQTNLRACDNIAQIGNYIILTQELSEETENGLYERTGCISRCDRDEFKLVVILAILFA